ncbi:MAG: alpha-amylase family glycosyl hydrolase [Candidatus Limnocylindrales bacterium]
MLRAASRLPLAMVCLLLVAGCGSSLPSATPPAASDPVPSAAASATPSPGSACVAATTPPSRDWNERTWYEVFVRSFADSDGDGIGDLRGLTSRLDYLNDGDPTTTTDLGIGGIWLMPIAESPSYHGYDVTDYTKVEPDYGTKADLEAFLAAAHKRGIKVIVDLVLNHTSSEHPWFKDAQVPGSAHDDWYVWSATNPGWLGPGGGVAWHEAGGRWYYGAFSDTMPDLNLRNPEVTAALEHIARTWLDDIGVDGFRLDAAKHLIEDGKDAQTNTPETKAWLAGFKQLVDAANPDALLVGEVFDPPTIAGAYVPGSVDLTFNFGLAKGTILALQNGRAAPLATGLGETIRAWPPNQAASFLSNHDQARVMSQLNGDLASAKLAAFTLFTAPGVPFVYYGEEIGMTGIKPDERIRTPMLWTVDPPAAGFSTGTPWEDLSGDIVGVDVASELRDPVSLLTTYQDLIRVRSQQVALRDGATTVVTSDAEPVIGWLRTIAGETVLAVVNVSDQPVGSYGLTLGEGPLCGPQAATLLGTVGGDAGAAVTAPAVNAGGGVDAWRPVAELAPRSGYLISLAPAP